MVACPSLVEPGTQTEFTYFLRPEFTRNSQGFEAIALEASVPLTFRKIQIDGTPTAVDLVETNAGVRSLSTAIGLVRQARRTALRRDRLSKQHPVLCVL